MTNQAGESIVHWGYKPHLLDSGLSVWLDHFRWIAAFAVVCDHVRWIIFPNFESRGLHPHFTLAEKAFFFLTRFGLQAVVLFFVISGLLVGGSLLRKVQEGRFHTRNYALDRVSRLGVVLVPAVVWAAALQFAGYGLACQAPDNGATLLGNLVFLQNLGFVAPLCNNHPLWSLSSEAWFYVIAPAFMLLWVGQFRISVIITLIAALGLGVLGLRLDHETPFFGLLLWSAGLLPWFVTLRIRPLFPAIALVVVLALTRTSLFETHAMKDVLITLCFTALLCTDPAQWSKPAPRFAHYFAGFSYSLYLVHMPAAQAVGSVLGTDHPADQTISYVLYVGTVGLMVLVGWIFGQLFEKQTPVIRNFLYRLTGAMRWKSA
ncbi:acyltransferase family protein [Novosphingobium sediminicola]|uniref:Peptidoglycan/LPS O-acetylase OafA/YrhL n=1 Tax=Novosphingobium sediminicola TaxID=563162 RepID=A0A7W6CHP1_9SPHN|nr:acyltransferase [Novosphingobium sediminicola]MBB3954548.1 peptidoglycan/LPS O-acetylase OafA/YrhL [Novosphingobium sediminicola]